MNRKRVILITGIIFVFAAGILFLFLSRTNKNRQSVTIGSATFKVIIANSESERVKGLSGYESLAENEGMLFVFPAETTTAFWMEGMVFDLDFIFIRDGVVADIRENVMHPESGETPKMVRSDNSFDHALEVKSGTIRSQNIQIGNAVRYSR